MDTLLIKKKLDAATTAMAPGGVRPPPYETRPVEFTYGELMLIWSALDLRDAIRAAVKE